MQVPIGSSISIHINMNMIIGICRSLNVNIKNISVHAGINTGIILNI